MEQLALSFEFENTKKCSKCGIEKDKSEFYKNKLRPSGISSECKICHRTQKKEYYALNKEEKLSKSKEYYEINKEEILIKRKEYQEKNKDLIKYSKRKRYLKSLVLKGLRAFSCKSCSVCIPNAR